MELFAVVLFLVVNNPTFKWLLLWNLWDFNIPAIFRMHVVGMSTKNADTSHYSLSEITYTLTMQTLIWTSHCLWQLKSVHIFKFVLLQLHKPTYLIAGLKQSLSESTCASHRFVKILCKILTYLQKNILGMIREMVKWRIFYGY